MMMMMSCPAFRSTDPHSHPSAFVDGRWDRRFTPSTRDTLLALLSPTPLAQQAASSSSRLLPAHRPSPTQGHPLELRIAQAFHPLATPAPQAALLPWLLTTMRQFLAGHQPVLLLRHSQGGFYCQSLDPALDGHRLASLERPALEAALHQPPVLLHPLLLPYQGEAPLEETATALPWLINATPDKSPGLEPCFGWLAVCPSVQGRPLRHEDQQSLQWLARYAAAPIWLHWMRTEQQRHQETQRLLEWLQDQLLTAFSMEAILAATLEAVQRLLPSEQAVFIRFSTLAEGPYDTHFPERVVAASQPVAAGLATDALHEGWVQALRDGLGEAARATPLLSTEAPVLHPLPPELGMGCWAPVWLASSCPQPVGALVWTPASVPAEAHRRQLATHLLTLGHKTLPRGLQSQQAMTLATVDELTGLYNRRGFYQRFELELERGRRHGHPLFVALVDVDHFKRLNDEHGHLVGDLVLHQLARLLIQNVRKTDMVARYGGEEFALLLPETREENALELLERVRKAVEQEPFTSLDGQTLLPVTISCGAAPVPLPQTPDGVPEQAGPWSSVITLALDAADECLYQAKHAGRNQVVLHPTENNADSSG